MRRDSGLGSTSGSRRGRPRLRDDERGQVVTIGAALMITTAILLLTTAQVAVAPQIQKNAEIRHSQTISADTQALQSAILKTSNSGIPQTTVLKMGTNYPGGVILVHPAPPSGFLENGSEQEVVIENAEAVNSETADYIDGSDLTVTSASLSYSPNYARYKQAPDLYLSYGGLFAKFENDTEVTGYPQPVQNRQLNIITSTADISRGSSASLLVRSDPLSASSQTTTVSDNGDHIRLRLETTVPEAQWREILDSQIDPDTSASSPASDDDSERIAELEYDESTTPNTLIIHLESNEQYQLNMARIGLRTGDQAAFPTSAQPDVGYITATSSTQQSVGEERTIPLTVQVRDAYSNPAANVEVGASATEGSFQQSSQKLTGQRGYVTFQYEAPEIEEPTGSRSSQTEQVTMSIDGSNAEHEVVFEVEVQNTN